MAVSDTYSVPNLGEKIWALRSERGLSAKALSQQAGLAQRTLLEIEKGRKPYGDTLRAIVLALHQSAPLTESDIVAIADASSLARHALLHFLERAAPVPPTVQSPADPKAAALESWRTRCHSLVDRMLARAESPEQVELALVAMIAVFEQSVPTMGEGPILTRRGEVRQVAPGVLEQKVEHRRTGA